MKKSKNGKVNAENLSGRRVPRKGPSNQTTGKRLGSRDVRKVGGRRYNFVSRGR